MVAVYLKLRLLIDCRILGRRQGRGLGRSLQDFSQLFKQLGPFFDLDIHGIPAAPSLRIPPLKICCGCGPMLRQFPCLI